MMSAMTCAGGAGAVTEGEPTESVATADFDRLRKLLRERGSRRTQEVEDAILSQFGFHWGRCDQRCE